MYPDARFRWDDRAALQAFVAHHAFAQISAAVDGRPQTAQAPLAVLSDGTPCFHLARANALVPHLDGAPVIAAVLGDHAYVSPDWYGTPDQVPTWNYRLAEISGCARRLDEAELRIQLDALSAAQEARLLPKRPWTSGKMDPSRLTAMLKAIVGFRIDAPEYRGVAKLGQNKRPGERAGAVAALQALGHHALAGLMAAPPALTAGDDR